MQCQQLKVMRFGTFFLLLRPTAAIAHLAGPCQLSNLRGWSSITEDSFGYCHIVIVVCYIQCQQLFRVTRFCVLVLVLYIYGLNYRSRFQTTFMQNDHISDIFQRSYHNMSLAYKLAYSTCLEDGLERVLSSTGSPNDPTIGQPTPHP